MSERYKYRFKMRFPAADFGTCYYYCVELHRQNNIDEPEGMENWPTKAIKRRINHLERQYGAATF